MDMDASGNFYCSLILGCDNNAASVFELSQAGGGGWTERAIYNFQNNGIDGRNPTANLIIDQAGKLYGTTGLGGVYGYGTAFALTHKLGGGWTEKQLYSFNKSGTDASYPIDPLTLGPSGVLYGTTNDGGLYSVGAVFEIKP